MIEELLKEVDAEVSKNNWLVVVTALDRLLSRRPKKNKPSRSQKHRRRLLAAYPFCHYCGLGLDMDTSTIDHVMPRSRGGTWHKGNLVLACAMCNRRKGCEMPEIKV